MLPCYRGHEDTAFRFTGMAVAAPTNLNAAIMTEAVGAWSWILIPKSYTRSIRPELPGVNSYPPTRIRARDDTT